MSDPVTNETNETPIVPPVATPPTTPVKPEPKFTQDDMDKIAGNRAKEASDAALKKVYKELGLNADDPDALKALKARLETAAKLEEEKLTAEEKLNKDLATERSKRVELEAKIAESEQKALVAYRNAEVTQALITAKVNPTEAKHLVILLKEEYADVFGKVLNEEGKVTDKGMKALLEKAKEAYPKYFANPAPGSPSNYNGTVPEPNASALEKARSTMNRLSRF